MNLGRNLFNARKKSGFSQEEIAEKLGVTRQTISKWETDESVPDILQTKKLAVLYKLSLDEEVALTQIDVMKEQIVNICRVKREGSKDAFKLPAHKDANTGVSEATMHDDHAYVLAMLGWYLSEKRIESVRNAPKRNQTSMEDKMSLFKIRAPKKVTRYK